jgi:hypothetical protein
LIDYLVALMATEENSALDGCQGNEARLKQDLGDMGVFDPCMPLYLLYRTRYFQTMGFTGFEGRYYSLFENLMQDMARATNLQMLVTALACKYIFTGAVSHADIPDHPFVESERRQVFFAAAAGVPTFYFRSDTSNAFLARLVRRTRHTRASRRYAGFTRVRLVDFQLMLIALLRQDAPELVEMTGMDTTLADLSDQISSGESTAAIRLARRICDSAGAGLPLSLNGEAFNSAAETFYRGKLKQEQTAEAVDAWCDAARQLDALETWRGGEYNPALFAVLRGDDAGTFIRSRKLAIVNEELSARTITRLIHLMLLTLNHMQRQCRNERLEARPS